MSRDSESIHDPGAAIEYGKGARGLVDHLLDADNRTLLLEKGEVRMVAAQRLHAFR